MQYIDEEVEVWRVIQDIGIKNTGIGKIKKYNGNGIFEIKMNGGSIETFDVKNENSGLRRTSIQPPNGWIRSNLKFGGQRKRRKIKSKSRKSKSRKSKSRRSR